MERILVPRIVSPLGKLVKVGWLIYGGDLECEMNPVKVGVPVNHKAQGREHLAMVLQKFDWTKCSAIAIPAKVNGKQ